MPFSTRPSKRAKRFTRNAKLSVKRSRAGRVGGRIRVPRAMGTFPAMRKCTLHYSQVIVVPVTAGFGTYYMSANGIFDPDLGSVLGHQPMYFDQLMTIYEHYHVRSSRIAVTYAEPTVAPGDFGRMCIYQDGDTTPNAANIDTLIERNGTVHKSFFTTDFSGPLRTSFNVKDVFSAPDTKDLTGFVGSNPTEQWNYCIGLSFKAGTTGNIRLNVELEYDVLFDELASINPS